MAVSMLRGHLHFPDGESLVSTAYFPTQTELSFRNFFLVFTQAISVQYLHCL